MHANLGNCAKSVMARHARADCLFSLGGGISMTGIGGSTSPDDPFATHAGPMTSNTCRFLLTLQSLSYGPQTATSISTKSPDDRMEQTMNTRSSLMGPQALCQNSRLSPFPPLTNLAPTSLLSTNELDLATMNLHLASLATKHYLLLPMACPAFPYTDHQATDDTVSTDTSDLVNTASFNCHGSRLSWSGTCLRLTLP